MGEVKDVTPRELQRAGIAPADSFQPATDDPSAQMMTVIARAASDATVDVDKMERLLDMQERMLDRQAQIQFAEAMVAVQSQLPTVARSKDIKHEDKQKAGVFKVISSYAPWEEIDKAIRPILDANGFSLTFRVETMDERTVVTAVLTHRGGHEQRTGFRLPLDTGGAKNNVQAYGSTITYGKRYTACALLNIVTEDDDTDGNVDIEESPVVAAWRKKMMAVGDIATLTTVTGPEISAAEIPEADLVVIRNLYGERRDYLKSEAAKAGGAS